MISLLPLPNSNECAAEVMEILFLFRKLLVTPSDTKKMVSVTLVISPSILQRNFCSMFFFLSKCKTKMG